MWFSLSREKKLEALLFPGMLNTILEWDRVWSQYPEQVGIKIASK